jgi:hypothetical protein
LYVSDKEISITFWEPISNSWLHTNKRENQDAIVCWDVQRILTFYICVVPTAVPFISTFTPGIPSRFSGRFTFPWMVTAFVRVELIASFSAEILLTGNASVASDTLELPCRAHKSLPWICGINFKVFQYPFQAAFQQWLFSGK